MLSKLFQEKNTSKIHRFRHKKMSTDVRKMERNQIDEKDFKRPMSKSSTL